MLKVIVKSINIGILKSTRFRKYKDSYDQAILDLEIKLKSTLSIQMQSDVPLGAFYPEELTQQL